MAPCGGQFSIVQLDVDRVEVDDKMGRGCTNITRAMNDRTS